jgi:hypothetical protein
MSPAVHTHLLTLTVIPNAKRWVFFLEPVQRSRKFVVLGARLPATHCAAMNRGGGGGGERERERVRERERNINSGRMQNLAHV